MKWIEAKQIAKAGTRVRQTTSDRWFIKSIGVWMVEIPGEGKRVVRSTDFGAPQYLARNWTTQPLADEDVCSRPGANGPVLDGPAVWVNASYNYGTGEMTIKGGLGAGTYGAYTVLFLVNGLLVATDLASEPRTFLKVVAVPFASRWIVTMRAVSSLPLPPWTGEATKTIRIVPSKIVLTATNFLASIEGPNPFFDLCSGELEVPYSAGVDLYTLSGVIDGFAFDVVYRYSTNTIESFAASTSSAVWWTSTPGDLAFPKASSSSVPQLPGPVYYDEAGPYDQPGEGGTNTSFTDGGTITVQPESA